MAHTVERNTTPGRVFESCGHVFLVFFALHLSCSVAFVFFSALSAGSSSVHSPLLSRRRIQGPSRSWKPLTRARISHSPSEPWLRLYGVNLLEPECCRTAVALRNEGAGGGRKEIPPFEDPRKVLFEPLQDRSRSLWRTAFNPTQTPCTCGLCLKLRTLTEDFRGSIMPSVFGLRVAFRGPGLQMRLLWRFWWSSQSFVALRYMHLSSKKISWHVEGFL